MKKVKKSKKTLKTILSGFGSLLVIFPATNYAQFVPDTDPRERMKSHWEDTGKHMRNALGKYKDEQKQR